MYDLSLQQYRRGSFATARLGFREFLRLYSDDDRATDALYYVGESFAPENADSAAAVYQEVVRSYPNSPRAPSSLYKLGLLAEQRGTKRRNVHARVVAIPSDEANLARELQQRGASPAAADLNRGEMPPRSSRGTPLAVAVQPARHRAGNGPRLVGRRSMIDCR
jgi:tetratricopeptide (TPR) repeat protein